MARLYANENFPLPVVEGLRALGHVVVTVQETGKANRSVPDHEVLEFAHTQNLALLTLNRRHFIRLHLEQVQHAGSSRARSIRTSLHWRRGSTRQSALKRH